MSFTVHSQVEEGTQEVEWSLKTFFGFKKIKCLWKQLILIIHECQRLNPSSKNALLILKSVSQPVIITVLVHTQDTYSQLKVDQDYKYRPACMNRQGSWCDSHEQTLSKDMKVFFELQNSEECIDIMHPVPKSCISIVEYTL